MLVDLVKIYTTNGGTGGLQFGSAVAGYRGVEALANGNRYSYSIQQDSRWEFGLGTYLGASNTFSRAPFGSSNGGAAVNFDTGVAVAFVALSTDILSGILSSPLIGYGAPAPTLGNLGQLYYDETGPLLLYGPKTASGWGTGYPITGMKGDPGAASNVAVGLTQLTSGPAANANPGDVWYLSAGRAASGNFIMTAGAPTPPTTTNAIDVVVSASKYFARVDTREYIANWWGVIGDGTEGANPTGTDNTATITTALNETAARGGRTLKFLPGQYNIGASLQSPSGSAGPAQIFLPPTPGGASHELAIKICGVNPPGSYIIDPRSTAIIQSTLTGTGGACFGSMNPTGAANGALASYYFADLCLRGMPNPGITMLDAYYLPILDVQRVTCDVANLNNGYVEPTYTDVPAIRGPQDDVPLWNRYDDLVIYGWNTGIQPGELFKFGDVNISNVKWLMHFVENRHPGVLGRLVATSFENGIKVTGACEIEYMFMDIEHASRPGWMPVTQAFNGYDVYDPNAYLRNPNKSPCFIHLHDGTPLNVMANQLKWQPPRPWQLGLPAFHYIFSGFQNTVDHRSLDELISTPGKPAWKSLVANDTAPGLGQPIGVWSFANEGGTGPQFIRGQFNGYYDNPSSNPDGKTGSPDNAGVQIYVCRNATTQKAMDINSLGYPAFPMLPVAASDSDAANKGIPQGGLYRIGNAVQIRIQ